jgi:hypothetical protein|tara:strand:+ start:15406 stop:15663 length:258 start_codon:yes stop_codon:yes gene_type:complete
MDPSSKIYQIMDIEAVTDDMWEDVYEDISTARFNNDNTKVILCWRGTKPDALVTDPLTLVWSQDEMLQDILIDDEWFIEEESDDA